MQLDEIDNTKGEKERHDSLTQNGGPTVENPNYTKLQAKQLDRLKAEEGVVTGSGGHDSRVSSFSSIGSASDLDQARKKARARRREQTRSESITSHHSGTSGMGGAGMVQYSQYSDVMHDDKVKGIGGHGSPALPTKNSHYKGLSLNVAF